MDNNKSLISIITPLYNAEKYIDKTIESVINQTYPNWELIIVDDGSSDNSLYIVQNYKSDKIHIIEQKNQGACIARNKGLKVAKGQYIKFLDADDVLSLDCLEQQINQIESLEEHQIPFGDYDIIDAIDNKIYDYKFDLNEKLVIDQTKFFFSHWEVLISAPLHRKDTLLLINGFDNKLKRGQESDLHFRLALSGIEFVYFNFLTFSYRSHNSDTRISNNKKHINLDEYYEYRLSKCETLLTQYGKIDNFYNKHFFEFKFSKARKLFSVGNIKIGNAYINDASNYDCKSIFFKFYFHLGRIISYRLLEKLFQLRLKLIKKKNQNFETQGVGKYI